MASQSVNGVALFYDEQGTGLPVVLIHGFPFDRRMWASQREDLGRSFRVITPDLRGFGESRDATPFTVESAADDLHALLTRINALPCVLGGLSMGGYIVMAFVRKYANDLRGLMLLDTRAEPDSPAAREGRQKTINLATEKGAVAVADQMLAKLVAPGTVEGRPEIASKLHKMMAEASPQTIANASVALRDRPDSVALLPTIKVPTLVVVGDGDQITPPEVAERMQKQIPGSRLAVIKGAGHMTPVEQPTQVNRVIRQFLVDLA